MIGNVNSLLQKTSTRAQQFQFFRFRSSIVSVRTLLDFRDRLCLIDNMNESLIVPYTLS